MAQSFSQPTLQTLYHYLQKRYDVYYVGTDYLLQSMSDYQALPEQVRPLYAVTDSALLSALTVTHSTEPFVSLTKLSARYNLHFKNAAGSTATGGLLGADLWLRRAAAERLHRAAELLQEYQPNYAFCITDAYRPLQLQRQHFKRIQSQLKASGVAAADLYHQTVALIADPDLLPPHSTGGALDITIYDRVNDRQLDMGTSVDAITVPNIHTWCPLVTVEQRHNRAVLCTVLTAVGFRNTPLEWWHFSYGDLEWALHSSQTATIYDSTEDLDESRLKP